jgi:hypothetical protein
MDYPFFWGVPFSRTHGHQRRGLGGDLRRGAELGGESAALDALGTAQRGGGAESSLAVARGKM